MSKRTVFFSVFTLTAVLTVAFAVSAQSADPWVGTWKVNLEKSKYSPGPPPKSAVRKVEPGEGPEINFRCNQRTGSDYSYRNKRQS
jgi:hypothetical protein